MNRRDFLRTTAGAFAAAAPLASAPARRPNVLMMLCDDLGYGDVGCFGGRIRTPNIDGMAASGVRPHRFLRGESGVLARERLC